MSLPAEIQRTLSIIIFGGVFERFPKLQIVSAENDVSWIPHFLYRLDHAYDRFRHFEGVNLPMLPSEYMKRNVVATFQFEQATAGLPASCLTPSASCGRRIIPTPIRPSRIRGSSSLLGLVHNVVAHVPLKVSNRLPAVQVRCRMQLSQQSGCSCLQLLPNHYVPGHSPLSNVVSRFGPTVNHGWCSPNLKPNGLISKGTA